MMLVGGMMALATPDPGAAQLSLNVQLTWNSGVEAWQPRRYVRQPSVMYSAERSAVRIPPGHMPPRGYCRAWIPGVPPGHQPAPEPCGRLLRSQRYRQAGVVIVGGPGYLADAYGGKQKAPKAHRKGRKGRRW